jgi:hypothetical protein
MPGLLVMSCGLGSVLSLEKLGQIFFAVIMTKTPLLMGFLVHELNCRINFSILTKNFTILRVEFGHFYSG